MMDAYTAESLDALRVRAEPGLREDADGPAAAAREELLQFYRERFEASERFALSPGDAPWDTGDDRAFDWIDALAAAGHVGAVRLLGRVLATEPALRALAARDPARVATLVPRSHLAALALAQRECAQPNPDFGAVCDWLLTDWWAQRTRRETAQDQQEWDGANKIGAAIHDMHGILKRFSASDLAALRVLVARETIAKAGHSRRAVGALVHKFAMARLASADAGERAGGERLLARAAELGSDDAQHEFLRRLPDPEAICGWLPPERSGAVAVAIEALRSSAGAVNAEELETLRSARYLGLASGPHAVPEHGREPYVARLIYTLARGRLESASAEDRAAGERLLERAAALGSLRAQIACYAHNPDPDALCRQIDAGGEPAIAAALRELCSIAGAPAAADLDILGGSAKKPPDTGAIVHAFASARLKSVSTAERETGLRLLRRAADLGSPPAKIDVAVAAYEAAEDKRAFVREFMERSRDAAAITASLCLRLGAAIERGRLGAAPDLAEAASWYAKAVGKPPWSGAGAGALSAEFCGAVATAFDRRSSLHTVDDPALAIDWYDRGLAAGSESCFGAWMEACAKGKMGLAPDPDVALERIRRFQAAKPAPVSSDGIGADAIDAVIKRAARDLPDPAPYAPLSSAAIRDVEREFWRAIKDGSDPDEFELYLEQFPHGLHWNEARRKLASLRGLETEAEGRPVADPALAAKWLRVGAFMRSADALFTLGRLHLDGLGVERDIGAARSCFEQAAALGHCTAQAALTQEGGALLGLVPGPPRTVADSALDAATKLGLGEILLQSGNKERAWHLLNLVIEDGSHEQRRRARELIDPGRALDGGWEFD